jgi:hypothetical protein
MMRKSVGVIRKNRMIAAHASKTFVRFSLLALAEQCKRGVM